MLPATSRLMLAVPPVVLISIASGPRLISCLVDVVMVMVCTTSSKSISWPSGVRIRRRVVASVGRRTGGESLEFHRLPITYGSVTSPLSNATSTSSPICGMKYVPRPFPACGTATRAQGCKSGRNGKLIWTRPNPSVSTLLTTVAAVTP